MKSGSRKIVIALSILAVTAVAACREAPRAPAPPPVTAKVERRDLTEAVSEEGTLGAARVVPIIPEADKARLLAIHVKEGDLVRQGDLLYEFDPKPIDEELIIIRAGIEALQLKLKYLQEHRAVVESVEARQSLRTAEDEHQEDLRKLGVQKQMTDLGLAPAAEAEALATRAAAGELAINVAKTRAEELAKYPETPEMADLKTRLLELQNRLREYQEVRGKLTGTAPFAGRVIKVDEQVKNLADAQGRLPSRVPTGKGPLVTIADIDTMKVTTGFFENDIARIALGQKAQVTAKHVPGRVFEGTVSRIGEFGSPRGQSATLPVEVTVDNREHLLKPGLTAEVRVVVTERRGVLAVPVEYVRHEDKGTFAVRLGAGGNQARVAVRTGASDGRLVEILEGLGEQDVLVLE